MGELNKKRVGIFDIDGTIFRSSLLIELTDALIQEGVFPSKTRKTYKQALDNWVNRSGSYQEYLDTAIEAFIENIKGVKYKDFSKISEKVIAFHGERNYKYTTDLIKKLKKKNYFILAISGSPYRVVKGFAEKLGFDKAYGRVLEIEKGKFIGKVLYSELIENKDKILKRAIEKENLTLKGSVGVGDTETDISFLKMVDNPICFNPNKNLYNYAKKKGWEIVVERKDVVYKNI
jgi:HAD superfamily hydrolase (TIGR01490 family)